MRSNLVNELLKIKLDRDFLFKFLTDTTRRYRVARHVVLWTVSLFLIYKRFDFNSILLTSPDERQMYVNFSTLIFGGLTILDYALITLLLRQFVHTPLPDKYFCPWAVWCSLSHRVFGLLACRLVCRFLYLVTLAYCLPHICPRSNFVEVLAGTY